VVGFHFVLKLVFVSGSDYPWLRFQYARFHWLLNINQHSSTIPFLAFLLFALLSAGGDPVRSCWWHDTEITLDHLRASPAWQKQMAELQLARARDQHDLYALAWTERP
jgi:hypothetical protein